MTVFIPQRLLKLMLFLLVLGTSLSCESDSASHIKAYDKKELLLPSGEIVTTYIARSVDEQKRGLSKINPEDFKDNEGMFFTGDKIKHRQFWMPEVYFDLDLFFLSKDLYVLDVQRNLKSHRERFPESEVPRSKTVLSVHVLELKSTSPLAKKIEQGMLLKWKD